MRTQTLSCLTDTLPGASSRPPQLIFLTPYPALAGLVCAQMKAKKAGWSAMFPPIIGLLLLNGLYTVRAARISSPAVRILQGCAKSCILSLPRPATHQPALHRCLLAHSHSLIPCTQTGHSSGEILRKLLQVGPVPGSSPTSVPFSKANTAVCGAITFVSSSGGP